MAENLVGIIMGLAIGLVLVAIVVVVFRWLWNTTLPEVFGLKEISVWQALKIILLAGILFGGQRAVDLPHSMSPDPAPATTRSE